MNLKETAEKYEPKKTKNVTDLDTVSVKADVEEKSGTDLKGKSFKYLVIIKDDEEYRLPYSVVDQIQNLLFEFPKMEEVKVKKKGEGMNTKYTVLPVLEPIKE